MKDRAAYQAASAGQEAVGTTAVPASASPVDAVVSMDVIEHLTLEDGRRMLDSIHGLLRPGGLFVVGTPNVRSAEFASQRRL